MSDKCQNCSKYFRSCMGYKKIIKSEEEARLYSERCNKKIAISDALCNKCRLLKYRNKPRAKQSVEIPTTVDEINQELPEAQELPLEECERTSVATEDTNQSQFSSSLGSSDLTLTSDDSDYKLSSIFEKTKTPVVINEDSDED